jgi:hypothetical protein
MVFSRTSAGRLVDYLDPEAVGKFITLTYEKYYARFPEHFGKTIDSAFFDEPTCTGWKVTSRHHPSTSDSRSATAAVRRCSTRRCGTTSE